MCYVWQCYRVPQYNQLLQENELYRKLSAYINSLASVEDSDFANLVTGSRSNDVVLSLDPNQTVFDSYLGARVAWTNVVGESDGRRCFVLRIRKKDKRRILRPYLQHILAKYEEFERELKLYINCESRRLTDGRWRSVPFTHQATMETVAMDSDLKSKVKSDLELFLKSKQYYQRLGRVWKRSYLLHGVPGTGKSSFVAAMAKLLCYDVYDVDLSQVSDDADLKLLLLQTTPRSLILIEDLDRFLIDKSTTVSLPGVLNFMDGVLSCCGEERVMVFTMNSPDQIDPTVLRPGRIDVHVQFGLCDFSSFKMLADSHLGIKGAPAFPSGRRDFPDRSESLPGRDRRNHDIKSEFPRPGPSNRESVHTVREFRKLYGLLRRSGRKEEPLDLGSTDKDAPRNGS
ncbi:AAA-ATPase [Vitis vinifera]|uniref:AAA-ATPase n=1 Tax=Vitis vinifera TaxID=29760 RepID=A0A438BU49_VITVI|nr:AAA-ATPase [Vitis vinifera]